jgi:hypothetical protein
VVVAAELGLVLHLGVLAAAVQVLELTGTDLEVRSL